MFRQVQIPVAVVVIFMCCGVCCGMVKSAAAQSLKVSVDAQLDIAQFDAALGTATYRIENLSASPVTELSFLLYPNRYAELPSELPEYARGWIYPSGFSAGKMTIKKVVNPETGKTPQHTLASFWAGKTEVKNLLMKVRLPGPLNQGDEVRLEIQFSVTVPKQRARFGYYDGVLSLPGGWLPRLLPVDATFDQRPVPCALQLSLTIPEKTGGFVLDRVVESQPGRQRIEAALDTVEEATVVLMEQMQMSRFANPAGDIYFVTSQFIGPEPFPAPAGRPSQGNRPPTKQEQRITKTAEIVKEVRGLFARFNLPPKDFFVVEIPAWDRLTQVSGNALLMSDRTFEVVQYPKAQMFHESDVAKTVAIMLARQLTGKEGNLAPLMAEVTGYHFQKRYLEAAVRKREELAQLLRFFAFNPYVDNLLYAPQMPFDHAYLRSIEETDIYRAELWRALNALPRGKRILAKLEDLLGDKPTMDFFDRYLSSPKPFLQLMEETAGNSERFRRQWFGRYPKVGYALGESTSTRHGRQFWHEVKIEQTGAPIVEPVTVRLVDMRRNVTRVVWNGEGMAGVVRWKSDARLVSIQLDPDFRLVETTQVQGHPLSDNTWPMRMRPPLLTDLLIWGDSVTREPFMLISFSLKRKYDISNSIFGMAAYTPRQVGGDVSYFRHFGYNRTLNSRSWYAGPRLGVYKFQDAAATETTIPIENRYTATMGFISMQAGMDDRQYALDPQSGKVFQISLGYWAGKSEYAHLVQHAQGSVRLLKVLPIALGHTAVVYGGVNGVVGTPPASNLVTLSHRQILRGFDLGETYGKLGVYGVMEYRHTLIGATSVQFPFRTQLDRVQGVLFAGMGSVSHPENYDTIFQRSRNFAEVGYGLRFHMLLLGAVPYLLAIDFAVPVLPLDRTYEQTSSTGGVEHIRRAPFRFVFGVTQAF